MIDSAPPHRPPVTRRRVLATFDALDAKLEDEGFVGWDPYDGLSSNALRKIAQTPLLRRVAIQTLKRSPVNVRWLLRIPKQEHTKALALLVSAYSRVGTLADDEHARRIACELASRLAARSISMADGAGWGYDFDVQTRWGYYRRGEANAVATAFAAHAFFDAAEMAAGGGFKDLASAALRFVLSDLLVEDKNATFFSYYPGSERRIHNSNILVASICARGGNQEQLEIARRAVDFSVQSQRPDGSWPYGEGRNLAWVDGFHTAYMLWGLARWNQRDPTDRWSNAISHGVDFYIRELIDADGAPRATRSARLPIDIHAASSAIWALNELGGESSFAARNAGNRVLKWTLDNMLRGDGRFAFQRHRFYRNSIPYIRWSDAHMMLALASCLPLLDT